MIQSQILTMRSVRMQFSRNTAKHGNEHYLVSADCLHFYFDKQVFVRLKKRNCLFLRSYLQI